VICVRGAAIKSSEVLEFDTLEIQISTVPHVSCSGWMPKRVGMCSSQGALVATAWKRRPVSVNHA